MDQPRTLWTILALVILSIAQACTPAPVSAPTPVLLSPLAPYATETLAILPTPTPGATEIPIPTPTPFPYSIARGDTLSSIAERFNVELDEILSANPGIVPQALSVGQMINIPASSEKSQSGSPTAIPVALQMSQVSCYPSGGGRWCFVLVTNPYPDPVENVVVQISLIAADGAVLESLPAYTLINIIPGGSSLPLSIFFAQPAGYSTAVASLQNATQLLPGDTRYLTAFAKNVNVRIRWDGRSADVSGQIAIVAANRNASQVWLVAVAYDKHNRPVGLRRWEWAGRLSADEPLPFDMQVYSTGEIIDHIDIVIEARP